MFKLYIHRNADHFIVCEGPVEISYCRTLDDAQDVVRRREEERHQYERYLYQDPKQIVRTLRQKKLNRIFN